ncbi:MAG: S1 RNA-binding domain-containing protein, partial [Thermodesulfobacteriota bacterium]|nr:S1 RNA-binding domain-containing protein [Thermodesulfobacteriota bacterium]
SAVHPESYPIVDAMAKDIECTVLDLMKNEDLRRKIDKEKYISDTVGLPTLNDILEELEKPGRDPRKEFETFTFAQEVEKLEDLEPGMKLPGVITNVTAFGAFVDIGVHQDGLVHVSQLTDHFVKDPGQVVKVHDTVMVTVLEVDLERKRISLSMKKNPELDHTKSKNNKKPQEGIKPVQTKEKKEKKTKKRKTFSNNPFEEAFKSR